MEYDVIAISIRSVCNSYIHLFIFFCRVLPEDLEYFSRHNNEKIPFQPALKQVFHSDPKTEVSPKESVKEHIWNLHFAEYGRYVFVCILLSSIFL